ncbi:MULTISPECIES: fimbrial protein [Serratia]|uniref:fimbrial protein n=1 Tax=Serratia TaxID=613 RepID=UPI001F4C1F28|nr:MULTISPECIES: fimbrial protein [Serratia]ULG14589.1 SefA [Serratia proteamaculans]ULG16246.1 SefA [Serratia proteamaculans]ULG17405.1 SefA [Serratia proteamaculans]ULG17514.1 SefA [Serratia proteamaculans]CAI2159914.1 Fimbria A protein precursor [Serratia quinivorans]
MKINKIASVLLLASGLTAFGTNAADQGSGRVTFTGSIIEAACSVNPESSDQEVDLGQIAASQLADGGSSTPRNFEILLENCALDADKANTVTVTFGGSAADSSNQLLGITGTASGAGVAVTDGSGNLITLGQATGARELIEGSNTLNFSAYLQGISTEISTGEFQSVADFTLAYQ